jgi:hypothetical protein
MKKFSQIGLPLLGLMVAFAGCDAAKDKVDKTLPTLTLVVST